MNTLSKYVLLLLVSVLAACGSDDDAGATFTPGTPQPGDALAVTITASDFVTDGDPDTRATDSGPVTTFEDGDRVGIIILDKDKQPLYNNIPYKYVSSSDTWEFDNGNGEGKEICYYDSKARTYIVYYPYSAKADGCKNDSDLKAIFKPQTNQSTKEDYRASDLMVNTTTSATPKTSLEAKLEHVYASISLAPTTAGAKYVLEDGVAYTGTYKPNSADISNVNLTVDDDIYFLHQAADGTWRCILPAGTGTSEPVRCFYTIGSKTYGNAIGIGGGTVANTRYTSSPRIEKIIYSFSNAHVGDFYCINDKKEGYLIPGDFPLTPTHKTACIGIVFWVGSKAFDEDPLLKKYYPGCTHGLVVALQDAALNSSPTMNWSNTQEIVQNWVYNEYSSSVNIQKEDIMCGYSNTLALMAYNEAKGAGNGLRVLPCDAILQYSGANPTPENSSGWYFPSVMELKYMCWGQGQGLGKAGCDILNSYINKVGGTFISSDRYWSSTENSNNSGGYRAWGVNFTNGYMSDSSKYGNPIRLRLLLAF